MCVCVCVCVFYTAVQRDSNYLVEEFMLLANKKVAEFISERAPAAAVLRRHPPPSKRKIDHLLKVTNQMKLAMETHSSGAIHSSLERIRSQCEPHIFYALVLMTTKPMQNAMYVRNLTLSLSMSDVRRPGSTREKRPNYGENVDSHGMTCEMGQPC